MASEDESLEELLRRAQALDATRFASPQHIKKVRPRRRRPQAASVPLPSSPPHPPPALTPISDSDEDSGDMLFPNTRGRDVSKKPVAIVESRPPRAAQRDEASPSPAPRPAAASDGFASQFY